MPLKIDSDNKRFHDIVKGKIRKDLKKFIAKNNFTAKQGNKTISVPIHSLDTPRFRYDDQKTGGAGQGEGDVGDPMGGKPKPGPGKGKAGEGEGEKALELEVTLDELADMLGEELALPNIENKGKSKIMKDSHKYRSIRRQGPEGLRNFKRTYKEALKREISTGTYVPGQVVVPRKEDKRYRSSSVVEEEIANAVIIYMMDVSGSMGEEQKEIVRLESFWMNTWLKKQYKGFETRFIIHDTTAKEVDQETFFNTQESGGTQISSAYRLCANMIKSEFPTSEWNIYCFHFSDGDNWSGQDNELSIEIIRNEILPHANQFGYGQVKSGYGSGDFINVLKTAFSGNKKVVTSQVDDKEMILHSIKEFLSNGN